MLAMPALLGHDANKPAYGVSFVIPFSTPGGFATCASFVAIYGPLLAVVGISAITGGYSGSHIMHFRLSSVQIKKLIVVRLLLLAGKMIFDLLAG